MNNLFEIRPVDRDVYEGCLRNFLPDEIIDIHTHVWMDKFKADGPAELLRTVTWPFRVARDNSVSDLIETYRLMFPDKKVTPMIFSELNPEDDQDAANRYVAKCAAEQGFPALLFASPKWSAEELEQRVLAGRFLGCKVYLTFAEPYIPEKEIRIFDFLPPHQLQVLNRRGWIVMLHIPRDGRLKDPVNLAQMLEIEQRYPGVKLIIAHAGRAYCREDIGDAFEILKQTKNMMFDISANCNEEVFIKLIETVGPDRILYGSDLPILRMRARRICENGNYVNIILQGMYGDVAGDRHMREVTDKDADRLTFLLYEELLAFKRACQATGLGKEDILKVFYNNAFKLIRKTE